MPIAPIPTTIAPPTIADEPVDQQIDHGDFDFPMDPDDWGRDKKVCQYFNAANEADICTTDPEYFIRGYCWDPGCLEVHTWYYCLWHFGRNIASLAHDLCSIEPGDEIVWYLRTGDIPPRYQILDWGRIGEEGLCPLDDPFAVSMKQQS